MEKIEGLAGFAPALLIGSQSTAYLLKVYRSEGREEMWPEYVSTFCDAETLHDVWVLIVGQISDSKNDTGRQGRYLSGVLLLSSVLRFNYKNKMY